MDGIQKMDHLKILENAFYFLALLNPASKVLFLATYDPPLKNRQVFTLAWKSSLAAWGMLVVFTLAGKFILSEIFRVDIYSLKITGGLVLFLIGWTAIREGRFMQKRHQSMKESFTDLSLVPLAAPLIAGPGTIAAAISSTAEFGILATTCALTLAIFTNFIFMIFSPAINSILEKTHLLGPLIRLTGLIIAATAMQMIATGVKEFLK